MTTWIWVAGGIILYYVGFLATAVFYARTKLDNRGEVHLSDYLAGLFWPFFGPLLVVLAVVWFMSWPVRWLTSGRK